MSQIHFLFASHLLLPPPLPLIMFSHHCLQHFHQNHRNDKDENETKKSNSKPGMHIHAFKRKMTHENQRKKTK